MNPLPWLLPWEPSLFLSVVTAVTAILFIRGSLVSKPLPSQKLLFWLGLASLYAVSHTQIDYYAEHEFFVHQLQSLVLHHLAPFLLVLAYPLATLSAGLPMEAKPLLEKVSKWKPLRCLIKVLFHPVCAVLLFVGLIVFWLLPAVHFIAMLDWRIYRLMNWSMAINGLMFWGGVLNSHSSAPSPGCRIAMLLAAVPPQILAGALIFFSPQELYPIYSLCGRAFAGMSPLTDQQIGGLILWMHGALMSAVGVVFVMQREWWQAKPRLR